MSPSFIHLRLHAHRAHRGFTLVELLVVMVMLSLVMLASVSALRSMAQTEVRVDSQFQRTDQIRVVQQFLQQALSRVDATPQAAEPGAPGAVEPRPLFEARSDSLSWVGIMPARPGAGGRYVFRLALEKVGEGVEASALVLRYLPWADATGFPDWRQAESHVLALSVTQLAVLAQGLPRDPATPGHKVPDGWQSGWPDIAELPQRLQLQVIDAAGPWPLLGATLHPTFTSLPGQGGFVIGGGK